MSRAEVEVDGGTGGRQAASLFPVAVLALMAAEIFEEGGLVPIFFTLVPVAVKKERGGLDITARESRPISGHHVGSLPSQLRS